MSTVGTARLDDWPVGLLVKVRVGQSASTVVLHGDCHITWCGFEGRKGRPTRQVGYSRNEDIPDKAKGPGKAGQAKPSERAIRSTALALGVWYSDMAVIMNAPSTPHSRNIVLHLSLGPGGRGGTVGV
jgi:hypothetical protein